MRSGPASHSVRQVAEDVGVGRLRRVLGVAALLLGIVAVRLRVPSVQRQLSVDRFRSSEGSVFGSKSY